MATIHLSSQLFRDIALLLGGCFANIFFDFFDIAPAFAVPRVVNAGKDIHTIEWCLSQAVSLSHSWTVTNCQPPYRREHLQSPASRLSFESTSRPHHG